MNEAWRNVKSRGWRAGLTIALMALALAANTIVFSAADSFVLHRVPYADPDQLVEIPSRNPQTGAVGGPFFSAGLLDEWRRHTDLFAGVEGYLTKTLFLTAPETQRTATADVTPGLIDLLGAAPRWGRSLTSEDAAQIDPQMALISEALAAERFGDPAHAIGQIVPTSGRPLMVVGVMPREFQFPAPTTRVWRALDPRGELTKGFGGVRSIARLARGRSFEDVRVAVQQRAAQAGLAAGLTRPYGALITPLPQATGIDTQRRLFLILLGTALCLLLTACANVASLELANAVTRARTCAIQLALGASRRRLIGTALLEGFLLIGSAALVATVLARVGADFVAAHLPDRIQTGTVNPIDLDVRALLYMVGAAALTWIVASLPVAVFAARTNVVELLKLEGTGMAASARSVSVRRLLTVAEIAVAVVLLVGSVLYGRTYASLLRLDKGLDTTNAAVVTLSLPARLHPSLAEKEELSRTLLERLAATHSIVGGIWGSAPPDLASSNFQGRMAIDGGPPQGEDILIGRLSVQPAYFSTLGIALRRGRTFAADDPPTNVIVSESLASRFWPGADPLGHLFRWDASGAWLRVVGVAAHVRTERDPPGGVDSHAFQIYSHLQPAAPRPAAPANASGLADNGGSYGFVSLTVRVESRERLAEAVRIVRSIEPRGQVKAEWLDDVYAARFGDRLMAMRVIGAFGILAFVLAAAGVYGVMTFLVATRAREIGIRMALGADGASIRRLVVGSSLRLVVAGLAIGAAGAFVAARWIESQLFGVRPADPATWTLVTVAVVAIALLATWQPARHAGRVDPSVLLRG